MDIKKIQQNKDGSSGTRLKLVVIVGIILIALLAIVFFLFSGEKDEAGDDGLNTDNIYRIIQVSNENPYEIQLYDFKKNKLLDKVDISDLASKDTELNSMLNKKETKKETKEDAINESEAVEGTEGTEAVINEDEENVSIEEKPKVLYVVNEDINTLYVYINKNVLKFTQKDNKLQREIIMTNNNLSNVSSMFIQSSTLLLVKDESNEIYRINLETKQLLDTVKVNGLVSFATEIDGIVYYLINSNLYKYDTNSNTANELALVDKPTDIRVYKDEIYILSPFGSDLNNSLLLRVDNEKFIIENLLELKQKTNTVLSMYPKADFIYISQKSSDNKTQVSMINTTDIMDIDNKIVTDRHFENTKALLGLFFEETKDGLTIFHLVDDKKDKNVYKMDVGSSYFYTPFE